MKKLHETRSLSLSVEPVHRLETRKRRGHADPEFKMTKNSIPRQAWLSKDGEKKSSNSKEHSLSVSNGSGSCLSEGFE